MDLETQTLGTTELYDLPPADCTFSTYDPEKTYFSGDDGDDVAFPTDADADIHAAETGVIEAIYKDDKSALVAYSKRLFERVSEAWDRSITSKLLQLCCAFDSEDCAASLLDGELGAVPLVNEIDEAGKSPLHTAAEYHAARCTELLLRKRARTDLRTKDGHAQLPLEMSLSSARTEVVWNPDDYSIEDLVVLLGEKDLTTIRLISEKTKEVAEVACAKAVEGRIAALAALLVVAAETINDTTLEFRFADSGGSKEKTTVYECVVREALSLGRETTLSSTPGTANDTSCSKKRKLLLSEIELLQLFGVIAQYRSTEKKIRSLGPLFRAVQAGDETVVALLLKASVDIDETDAEGNSVLHYSVKASRAPTPQEINILILLLKYGARVSQKNKLGLTPLHLAAANGHLQAVQILLLEDPDGINYKTEVKETPLFFAVKNDHMDCAELLLRWGANSEVLNLRQRPIDLAKSQDMRFMLNPTNIGLMKRNFPVQQKHATWSQEDEGFLDNCNILLSMRNEETTCERTGLSATTDICKYFSSPHGCVRGEKCFYAHCEEVRQKVKQGSHRNYSPSTMELKKKIFVGGLPPSLNSVSLRKYFEENFGPVLDAKVLETQIGNHTQSRGFGFVTFKDEKPVSAAVQAHYVTIMDKQVEIKSMLPRCLLENESHKLSAQQYNQGKSDKLQPQAQLSSEIFVGVDKPQQRSWLNNILSGEIITCSNDAQAQAYTRFDDQKLPTWLRIFIKWLPSFLQYVSKHSREGEYALSSLKGDFRAKFGLDLDHVSLGYPKLSDFMKCFSDLFSIKVVPIGRGGSPNHMVLVPRSSGPHQQLRCMLAIKSIINEVDKYSNESKRTHEERTSVSSGNASLDSDHIDKQNPSTWSSHVSTPQEEALSPNAQPKFMQLLKQDPLFHIRPWIQNEYNTAKGNGKDEVANCIEESNGNNLRHQPQNLVLEAFARSRKNPSVYFLREFDFYRNYYACVKEGKCFACNEQEVLWANFPCQHLLWCIDCKMQASIAAASSVHKCVVCDMEVQRIDLLNCHDYHQLVGQYIFHEEFPPFDPNQIRCPFTKKPSSVGN